jgi:hypothetical protein
VNIQIKFSSHALIGFSSEILLVTILLNLIKSRRYRTAWKSCSIYKAKFLQKLLLKQFCRPNQSRCSTHNLITYLGFGWLILSKDKNNLKGSNIKASENKSVTNSLWDSNGDQPPVAGVIEELQTSGGRCVEQQTWLWTYVSSNVQQFCSKMEPTYECAS